MPIEVRPANLALVVNYNGRMVPVADDVTDVAKRLAEIDPCLKLFFAAEADPPYWTVEYHQPEADGSITERLVLTSLDLGSHIVDRVALIGSEGYDFVAELDRRDRAAAAQQEAHFADQRGELHERLAWAIRKDLGLRKSF